MLFPFAGPLRSGGGHCHTAALGLGLGQTDELVTDDVVRETERALEFVESAGGGHDLGDHVVTRRLLVDRVRELALAPPIDLAVEFASGGGDTVGHHLHPGLRLGFIDVAVDDDHHFVCTHHACFLPSDPPRVPDDGLVAGAPVWGRANMDQPTLSVRSGVASGDMAPTLERGCHAVAGQRAASESAISSTRDPATRPNGSRPPSNTSMARSYSDSGEYRGQSPAGVSRHGSMSAAPTWNPSGPNQAIESGLGVWNM